MDGSYIFVEVNKRRIMFTCFCPELAPIVHFVCAGNVSEEPLQRSGRQGNGKDKKEEKTEKQRERERLGQRQRETDRQNDRQSDGEGGGGRGRMQQFAERAMSDRTPYFPTTSFPRLAKFEYHSQKKKR